MAPTYAAYDGGTPAFLAHPDSVVAGAFRDLAQVVARALAAEEQPVE